MIQKLYAQNKWLIFTAIVLVTLYFTWLMNAALPFNRMIYNSLSDQLSANRIQKLIEGQQKWRWLSYALMPILLIIKWFLVAVAIDVGAMFFEVELKFKKAFQIAMLSEMAFLLLLAVKFGWFFYNRDTLTLAYVQAFMPLSLSSFIDVSKIDKWFIYPLQVINIFELIYWLLLAYFLGIELKKPSGKAFQFVLGTYGVGLLIWIIFMAFLILNFS